MNLNEILAMDSIYNIFVDGPEPDPHIVAAGLVPPLPYAVFDRRTLIWGWSVVRAAVVQERAELPVQLVELSQADALEVAIRMEGRHGAFSLREQIAIADAAATVGRPLDDELSRLVRDDRAFPDMVRRIAALPQHLAREVVEGAIDLKIAERLVGLPSALFVDHGDAIHRLSHSRRRQFLEMLAEITHRDGLSAADVTELATQALAAADGVDYLRRLRLPTLVAMEEQFAAVVARQVSGSGVTISAPPYFEGDSYSVEFRFRSCDELAKRLAAIDELRGSCEELLGIL